MIDTPGAVPYPPSATAAPLALPGAALPAQAAEAQPAPRAFADWPGDAPWQPLPEAARRCFRVSALLLAGVISLGAGGVPLLIALIDREPGLPLRLLWLAMVVAAIFGFALWRASVAYRSTRWRLDEDGLRVRRGRLWRREVLVPRARVQHLDIERGPIERRYGLATLIVHTAGTRLNALRQPGFDEDTAARLRDALVPKTREVDLQTGGLQTGGVSLGGVSPQPPALPAAAPPALAAGVDGPASAEHPLPEPCDALDRRAD